ncbi:phage tail protein [Fulvivirgaceae bacterium PWU4]|uniref:Phage tail protein n=1 Tax=Chryseosolibacter histidini TaxID=2782349 RepID=A0AAP2GKH8_9BACT|nr:phage tail protein [Chryseosolibacter histidini]MBT1699054.1 phage tail protein [Chryseosolibacter histidini]
MALKAADIAKSYPLPVYNYRVDLIGDSTETIAFSEVSGLSISFETTTYKESKTSEPGPGPNVMHMPSQRSQVTITLKKGYVRANSINKLYAWIRQVSINQIDKKDVAIKLCNENGDAVVTWKAINAFPTKLDAPTFDANSNDAAIESMELQASRVVMEES